MTSFLTADTHFSHPLMLTACRRPFSDVQEMNEGMIEAWNAVVHPNDLVWHLGDFAMKASDQEVAQIFRRLNGRKRLIIGNHDVDNKGRLLPALARLPWDAEPAHAAEIKHDGQRIILSHYAGYTWNQEHRGSFLAYGHSHGALLGMPGSIDVGVDNQGLKPIAVEEFVRQAEASIVNAEERVEQIVDRMIGRLAGYREQAEAIRRRKNAGWSLPDDESQGFRP